MRARAYVCVVCVCVCARVCVRACVCRVILSFFLSLSPLLHLSPSSSPLIRHSHTLFTLENPVRVCRTSVPIITTLSGNKRLSVLVGKRLVLCGEQRRRFGLHLFSFRYGRGRSRSGWRCRRRARVHS